MRAAGRLGLFVAGLGVALGSLELAARLGAPEPAVSLRRGAFSVPGTWRNRSGEFDVTVQVNADGFADRPWGARQPGVRRVVVLGDSFVQAAQVPLEAGFGRELDAELGPAVEVLSMGVPGAGTATALGLLEAEALPRDPDAVVLLFLTANDVLNNHPLLDGKKDKPYLRLEEGRLVPWSVGAAAHGRDPLWRWSHLYRFVARRWLEASEARHRVRRGDGIPVELRLYDPRPDPAWEEAWAVTEALVARMAERAAAAGVAFCVLLAPDALEATASGRERALARWPALAAWDLEAPGRRAAATLGGHAPCTDLRPALRAADGGEPLYFEQDGHWTALGHRVAAAAAAPAVQACLDGAAR